MNISTICPSSFASVSSAESLSKNEKDKAFLTRNNVNNKTVKFDDIPMIHHFSADKNENKSTKLHVTVQEYRRAVDKQAKLYGLRAAFGHDQPFKDPYPYDHKVGLENMIKYNNK